MIELTWGKELCQRAGHNDGQLVSLHGSLFQICCGNKECAFEVSNYTADATVPGLRIDPCERLDLAVASLPLDETHVPTCPCCWSSKLRPGICWFGEKLPTDELSRVERWFQNAPRVDLVLVIGTERSPFVKEAIAKGAEVAWLNLFDDNLPDTGGDWYVNGCASMTLPRLVEAALR
jgi:NAD-dependent deacetylase sirtuin 5